MLPVRVFRQIPINREHLSVWTLGLILGTFCFGPAVPSLLMALFFIFQLFGLNRRPQEPLEKWTLIFLSLYLLLHVTGLLFTDNPSKGWTLIARRGSFFLLPIAFFSTHVPKKKDLHFLGWWMLAGLVSYLLLLNLRVVWEMFTQGQHWTAFFRYDRDQIRELAWIKPVKNEIYIGLLMNLSLVFIGAQWLTKRFRVFHLLLVCFLLINLWINAARMSLLLLPIIGVAMFAFELWKTHAWPWRRIVFAAGMLIGLTSLIVWQFKDQWSAQLYAQSEDLPRNHPTLRLANLLAKGDTTRLNNWSAAWQTVQQNPLLGTGTNNALKSLQKNRNPEWVSYKIKANAHNQYLDEALQFGLIGCLPFLGWLACLMILNVQGRQYGLLLMGAILLVTMITESILFRNLGILILTTYAYLCIAVYRCR